MPVSKNFKELFLDPDHRSQIWDETFMGKLYNCTTEETLEFSNKSAKELYILEYRICLAIYQYTKNTLTDEEKQDFLNGLKLLTPYISNVENTNSVLRIQTNNGDIIVKKLVDIMPGLGEYDPCIENDKRQGQCHYKSIELSNIIQNPHQVVTGFIHGASDFAKYLHTWIEITLKGKEYVFDYTLNACINKDGYYFIKHAEPLSRISKEDIAREYPVLCGEMSDPTTFNVKEYLVFRDEIIRALNKNRHLFYEDR